jgi:hypothetical protein
MRNIWKHYRVTLKFRDKVCGGVPKDPETIAAWIRSRIADQSKADMMIQEAKAAMGVEGLSEEELENLERTCWNGFKRNEGGLYLEGRCVKAAYKEAAAVLREPLDISAFKARVAERLFVVEDIIPLGRQEPDGDYESFIHAIGPQGPRNALKRVDYVTQATITYRVKMINQSFLCKRDPAAPKGQARNSMDPFECLELMHNYMQEGGIGADRSQGNGKNDLVSIEPLD